MPAPTTITIANKTPTNAVFRPVRVGEMSTLINTDSATNAGNMSIVLGYSFASAKRKTDRVAVRFNFPREATDSTTELTAVVDVARFVGEFIIPDSWTVTDRGHLATYVKNLFANAIVLGYTESRDPFYG